MKVVLVGFAALVLSFGCAREPTQTELVQRVEAQVWSPYCPGRLLIDCTTTQSRELRADVAQRVERGASEGEVLAWIRSEFGDEAIARPPSAGWGVIIWLVPALLFVIGAVVVTRFVASATRRSRSTPDV